MTQFTSAVIFVIFYQYFTHRCIRHQNDSLRKAANESGHTFQIAHSGVATAKFNVAVVETLLLLQFICKIYDYNGNLCQKEFCRNFLDLEHWMSLYFYHTCNNYWWGFNTQYTRIAYTVVFFGFIQWRINSVESLGELQTLSYATDS